MDNHNGGQESSKTNEPSVKKVHLEAEAMPFGWEKSSSSSSSVCPSSIIVTQKKYDDNGDAKLINSASAHHTFTPEDLSALVKNLELEINVCEGIYL